MNDNVLPFGGPRPPKTTDEDGFPENNYVITDIDDQDYFARGFLIFTPHHCAIMKDYGKGAVPELVVPLIRVKLAEMVADEDEPVT